MKRLEALEGLRGYAAFLVFLVHSCGLAAAALYGVDPDHLTLAQAQGPVAALLFFFRSHYGVDLFFVLSGLLMADIAARRWPGTRTFLARRALRIYPAYLASGALALVVGLWIFRHEFTAPQLAANAAVLQGFFVLGIAPLNPVTWSLSYEVAFYLAVPLLALAWGARAPAGREREAAWIVQTAHHHAGVRVRRNVGWEILHAGGIPGDLHFTRSDCEHEGEQNRSSNVHDE